MTLVLHSSPWGHFCGMTGLALEKGLEEKLELEVLPRLVGALPAGFAWNGKKPVCAVREVKGHPAQFDLPLLTHEGRNDFSCPGWRGEAFLRGLPNRAFEEEEREEDLREQWLMWQYERYKELAHVESGAKEDFAALEGSLPFGARRTWATVCATWKRGSEDTAELSLIVELARRQDLLQALNSISRSPRRMLRRIHQPIKLSRIQEMDPYSMRRYAEALGRTPAEKAGPRQELIAVVKEDTADLPENSVLMWSVRRMERMAAAYCRRNAAWKGHERYESVRRLLLVLGIILRNPSLRQVGALQHHMTTPTYCFQFERRYRHVWRAYLEIRKQQRAVDDAWRWQGRVWASTARILLASLLLENQAWMEARVSTPYFCAEGKAGEWTLGPTVPGPLSSPLGPCHVVDFRDPWAEEQADRLHLPDRVFASGADWVLCWPGDRILCLAWAALAGHAGAQPPDLPALRARLEGLCASTGWTWTGIVVLGLPEVGPEDHEWLDGQPPLLLLRLPFPLHRSWGDLGAGLHLTLEELNVG